MRLRHELVSKILVCFNCRFRKILKSNIAAAVIIRNHNEGRDRFAQHVMRIMDKEDLESVNSLPYYDGIVYRAVCACSHIIDRKSKQGIEYAMTFHEFIKEDIGEHKEHGFFDIDYDEGVKTRRLFTIPRSEYISTSKDEEVKLQENMARYNITQEDLNESTSIATVDSNLFWTTRSFSFNGINYMLFNHFKDYNCPRCNTPKQHETFKDLYWHYYREHYLNAGTVDWESQEMKNLNHLSIKLISEKIDLERKRHPDSSQRAKIIELDEHIDRIENKLKTFAMATKSGIKYHDTAISMLQQFVLVEIAINQKRTTPFKYDRASNALYQLNRIHGISLDDLRTLFFPQQTGRNVIAKKLFHGMVWTENKAPDWLDNVVKTMGVELGI